MLSRRGEIWDYITDATVGVLHSSEHRGGAGTALDRGVCSVAWCCAGLSSGTGNLPDIVNKAGNDNAREMQVLVERLRRDQQDAQRIDQITIHSPLITIHYPNDNAREMQVLVERLRRDQQNAQRIDQITIHSPLITIHSKINAVGPAAETACSRR